MPPRPFCPGDNINKVTQLSREWSAHAMTKPPIGALTKWRTPTSGNQSLQESIPKTCPRSGFGPQGGIPDRGIIAGCRLRETPAAATFFIYFPAFLHFRLIWGDDIRKVVSPRCFGKDRRLQYRWKEAAEFLTMVLVAKFKDLRLVLSSSVFAEWEDVWGKDIRSCRLSPRRFVQTQRRSRALIPDTSLVSGLHHHHRSRPS